MFDKVTKRDLLEKRLENMSVLLKCVPDEFLDRLTLDCFYATADTLKELQDLVELFPLVERGFNDDGNSTLGSLVCTNEAGLKLRIYYRRGLLNEKVLVSGPDFGLLKPAEVSA